MKIDHPRRQLAILFGRRWRRLKFSTTRQRIVKRPVLHVSLPPLHHRAANSRIPRLPIVRRVRLRKMQVRIRHSLFLRDPIEAQLPVRLLEAQWMRHRHLAPRLHIEPLIHSPKVRAANIESQLVDQPRHQRQLLSRTNRPAYSHRIILRALSPRTDVLQRFREVKVLQRIVYHHAKSRTAQLFQIPRSQTRDFVDQLTGEAGIIPPIGANGTGAKFHAYGLNQCESRIARFLRTI